MAIGRFRGDAGGTADGRRRIGGRRKRIRRDVVACDEKALRRLESAVMRALAQRVSVRAVEIDARWMNLASCGGEIDGLRGVRLEAGGEF
ncbi:uncharacterized protein SPSK_00951 [Sporothrix schenckii 1099-18]|uniref:Uncharacterized protein n=1 Tax=Sporothrix schenckii 1099-18 TaxID=1397361 RepID=A0A0F2LWH2_SPOSC|nr:uncharacterized protein SPSK_00951 [Sporothrix schenckii 1099-18]KJR81822.1 hypothetical protein SPSK_00951 [Sporothrix schenckii 1099-18]